MTCLCAIISSCRSDENLIGNSFSCLIDGERFIPKNTDWKGGPAIEGQIKSDTLILTGRNNENGSNSVGLRVVNFTGKGRYPLDDSEASYGRYYSSEHMTQYFTQSIHTGLLIIERYEPNEGVVAGKFSFQAIDGSGSSIVEVTKGEFTIDCAVLD